MEPKIGVESYTGIRPTGSLTIANYVGAVKPLIDLQNQGTRSLVFVADLHSLTDNEPDVAAQFSREVVVDYIALGVDPEKSDIYIQSAIARQVSYMTLLLARLASVPELLRVPTFKEKSNKGKNANALLLLYPVMMASDILLQRAQTVPVGEDQTAHLEITRRLARVFNSQYGEVFPIPVVQEVKSLRILSLKGDGKMSKSIPEGAVFLTDDPEVARKKIKKAETACEGEMSKKLESHIILAKQLTADSLIHQKIDGIIAEHMDGKQVMGAFKEVLGSLIADFLVGFQERRKEIIKDKSYIDDILEKGRLIASDNADETIEMMLKAMKLK